MPLQRIYPDRAPTTPVEATSGLGLAGLAPDDRPYLVLNMIATADGAGALGGRTRALGDETDREIFHGLRTQVECVMAGARTVRIERYGRLVRDPSRRERREREGLAADPLTCLVSGRLTLPEDLPLLQDPDSHVVVITGSDDRLSGVAAKVEYLRAPREAETEHAPSALASAVRRLRSEHGVRSVLCEGGPRLNRSLLAEDLVDELFLTVAPKLVAGSPETTIVTGAPAPTPSELELVTCLEGDGSLFLRYRVRR
jgi:riboflavin biosynthesis pyrimidine reductase